MFWKKYVKHRGSPMGMESAVWRKATNRQAGSAYAALD
jgi:hypothetical protein